MSAHDSLDIYNACGLHVTRLKGFKLPYFEIAINCVIEQIHVFQIAWEFSVLIAIARSTSGASQIGRVAENAKEMVSANLPNS